MGLAAAICLAATIPIQAAAGDVSFCDQGGLEGEDRYRCQFWRILAFTRPDVTRARWRITPKARLNAGRLVEASVSTRDLDSPWPEAATLRFYEEGGGRVRLVEEIVDHGLNGLNDDDPRDRYLRHQEDGGTKDLLSDLDPSLSALLNREYLRELTEAAQAFKREVGFHEPISWRRLSPGMSFARVQVERYIRLGVNELLVLRFSPSDYEIVPYHYREKRNWRPSSIAGWAREVPDAAVLFNAGQYYPDARYMGLFCKDGTNWGEKQHPVYMAMLLSGGPLNRPNAPPIVIQDLRFSEFDPQAPYRYAAQSFMLLDRTGRPRVRQSDRLASRTAVAQDRQGRILIVMVPGACTLYELALLLRESDLGVVQAMSLDGGFESELLIRHGGLELVKYGAWVVNEKRQYYSGGNLRAPLPAVLAVKPRAGLAD